MSDINIEVIPGGKRRLPTKGKYCEDDIVVKGLGGSGGLDTTDATATPDVVLAGETYYGKRGKETGTFSLAEELAQQREILDIMDEVVNNLPDMPPSEDDVFGDFDLTIDFTQYGVYGDEPIDLTGYYNLNGGRDRFFEGVSSISLIDAISATSTVKVVMMRTSSLDVYASSNCTVRKTERMEVIEGIEVTFVDFIFSNFTGNASVVIKEG